MIESEIRKYACCTDNLKAAIVFSIITIILDVAAVVLGIIFVSVLYYFFNVAWAIRVILPPLIGIFLIVKDSKLLYGSIKPSRGNLIAGAIMEGITFLGLLGICIYLTYLFFAMASIYLVIISIPWIFIAFKLWNLLIIKGGIQEVDVLCASSSK